MPWVSKNWQVGRGWAKKRRGGEGCCCFTPSYAPYFLSLADLFAVRLLHWLKCQMLRPTCSRTKSFPLKRGSNDRVVVAHHKIHNLRGLLKKFFNATMILTVKPQNQSIELWKNSFFTNEKFCYAHIQLPTMKWKYDVTFHELFHNLFFFPWP